MNITPEQLKQIYPLSKMSRINLFLPFINIYSDLYDVDTVLRLSAFLAQIGHESGQLTYTREIASGAAYEGRKDLGNIYEGDGRRYKGRGLIQVTGRYNYTSISNDFGIDFVGYPEKLSEPEWAVRASFWYWQKNNINKYADIPDFWKVTKKVNVACLEYKKRLTFYEKALKTLSV